MRLFLSWIWGAGIIAVMALGHNAIADQTGAAGKVKINRDYQLSGPYGHQNLSVFLIHGKSKIQGKRIISLGQALEKKMVTISETGDVNRLHGANHSDTEYVFIQSGDMVKGGRQDRTFAQDVLLPPKTAKIPLEAFCVEKGRWHKRGSENANRFSSSQKGLSSKQLKLAAKKSKSQQAVWQAVAAEQDKLSRQVGKSVRKPSSATSLQLSLEDKDVEQKCREYQRSLLAVGQREKDAVGFAFAINGQFNTADIYGDPDLFQRLWPKLIQTASYEAISQYEEKRGAVQATTKDVQRHLLDALNSRKKKETSTKTTRRMAAETKDNHAFETKDDRDQIIHLNIIKK